jgi:hypothetical protein
MSDERDQGGKWVAGFVVGLIAGVLLTLGIGAALLLTYVRRAEMLSR